MDINQLNKYSRVYVGVDIDPLNSGISMIDSDGKFMYSEAFIADKDKFTYKVERHIAVMKFFIYKIPKNSYVCIEAPFGGGRSLDIGECFGLLKKELYERNIPYILIPPKSLKLFITGNGNADKAKMALSIWKEYRIDLDNEHKTDSYSLAVMGRLMKEKMVLKEYQKRVISNLNKEDKNGKCNIESFRWNTE
jgi:Holliday junction resolvasome RuvABC endonuclease subunit